MGWIWLESGVREEHATRINRRMYLKVFNWAAYFINKRLVDRLACQAKLEAVAGHDPDLQVMSLP